MSNVSSSNSQKANVPKLRFPEFDNNWDTYLLSDFTERIMRKNKNNETTLPLTISSKDGLVDQITYFNKQVSSKDMSGYYLLKSGEFAYNKSYSVGYDYGSIKRLERYPMGALSTLYICFKLTQFDSDFIKVYFDSLKWYKEIYMIAAEGARNHGLLNVSVEEFFNTKHTLPSNINEQKKISQFFLLLEKRIEKQQRLVESLKSYKRGVLFSIFGDKSSNIKLDSLLQIGKAGGTPKSTTTKYYNGNIPFLNISDMTNQGKYIYTTTKNITEAGIENSSAWLVPKNSIILSMYASYGFVSINKIELTTSQAMFSMVPSKDISYSYLYHYLNYLSFTNVYERMVSTGTQPNLNAEKIKNIQIYLPTFDKQNFITTLLDLLDDYIYKQEKMFKRTNDLKSYLLQKLFI